ncbi:MAG: DUF192 domain-containing protein [Bacteroidota bacterium]
MAKNKTRKAKRVAPVGSSPKKNKPAKTKWWILFLLVPAIIAFIYTSIPKSKAPVGPRFQKEGELIIQRGDQAIAQLDIEIADNQADISQGLMYRPEMEEDHGMLFLMPDTDMQSFWMLNTEISLDIIFIGEDKRIINVGANTTPRSLDPVQSTAPARYVLEVNAGYFQRKGLAVGDELSWQRVE